MCQNCDLRSHEEVWTDHNCQRTKNDWSHTKGIKLHTHSHLFTMYKRNVYFHELSKQEWHLLVDFSSTRLLLVITVRAAHLAMNEWEFDSWTNLVIPTIMAAMRRLGVIFRSLSLSSPPPNASLRSPVKANRCARGGIAVAVGVAAGGAIAYYYYSETYRSKGRKNPMNVTGFRALLPSLPAVSAREKVWVFTLFSVPRNAACCSVFPGRSSYTQLQRFQLLTSVWAFYAVWFFVLYRHTCALLNYT